MKNIKKHFLHLCCKLVSDVTEYLGKFLVRSVLELRE